MDLSRLLFLLVIALASCGIKSDETKKAQLKVSLIDAHELMEHQGNYKLVDFRSEDEYKKGLIHGAVNVTRRMIENDSFDYYGMMAEGGQIEALLSAKGISNSDAIVVYDDKAACDAARLWFVLKHYGHPEVMLLNGGLTAWHESGGDVIAGGDSKPRLSNYKVDARNQLVKVIRKEDVLRAIADPDVTILDVRSKEEFSGAQHKTGAKRAGRIPNSINIDWANAVNYSGDRKFKSLEKLKGIFYNKGIVKDKQVIIYCHSGVRSSHTYFVLTELLGYRNVYNYDGSWVEWSHHDFPYETDSMGLIN